jgi:hypothetical protein
MFIYYVTDLYTYYNYLNVVTGGTSYNLNIIDNLSIDIVNSTLNNIKLHDEKDRKLLSKKISNIKSGDKIRINCIFVNKYVEHEIHGNTLQDILNAIIQLLNKKITKAETSDVKKRLEQFRIKPKNIKIYKDLLGDYTFLDSIVKINLNTWDVDFGS